MRCSGNSRTCSPSYTRNEDRYYRFSHKKKREDRYHLVHEHLQEINKKLDATWGYA